MEMATAALIVASAGTAMSAYGQYRQGQAQAQAQDYNAQVNRNNQQISEMNARQAEQAASYKENMQRDRAQRLAGAQEAKFAKSGVLMSGSPLDLMADQAMQSEMDALALRYEGDVNAWNARARGTQYGAQATLDSFYAGNSRTAGTWAAGSTLLSGAGNTMNAYNLAKKPSATSNWYDYY